MAETNVIRPRAANRTYHVITVIIPANNEAAHIGACLSAILSGALVDGAEIIVVANGCTDATAEVAQSHVAQAAEAGWSLVVLDLPQGSKIAALNAGDSAARFGARAYLDADVRVDPTLMRALAGVLQRDPPTYASGRLRLAAAANFATRAYAAIYAQVPFVMHGVPGAGLFAVNAAGRKRWDKFPDIISDDTFVRLSFAPAERAMVDAGYDWPLVEGFANLVRVRRRQNAGVSQIARLYPHLLTHDEKPRVGVWQAAGMLLRNPLGFAVYGAVAMVVKLTPGDDKDGDQAWRRGR